MIPLAEAERIIRDATPALAPLQQSLDEARGVLAAAVCARITQPQWPQSAMDGYALRHADLRRGPLTVQTGIAAAGQAPPPLQAERALRITTGSPLPPGADTVIIQEHARLAADLLHAIEIPALGANVRPSGEDFISGQVLAEAGQALEPGLRSLLHHANISCLLIRPPPRMAVIVTGSELIRAGSQPAAGQSFDSNGPFLQAWAAALGCAVQLHHCDESPQQLAAALETLRESCDLFVICGGASVGPRDGSHAALQQLGARCLFQKVAQKPGKPMAYYHWAAKPVLLLPGNPAAVFCGSWWHLRPLLQRLQAAPATDAVSMELLGSCPWPRGRSLLLRGRASFSAATQLQVRILPGQASHLLANLAECNAIVRLDPGQQPGAGSRLQGQLLSVPPYAEAMRVRPPR